MANNNNNINDNHSDVKLKCLNRSHSVPYQWFRLHCIHALIVICSLIAMCNIWHEKSNAAAAAAAATNKWTHYPMYINHQQISHIKYMIKTLLCATSKPIQAFRICK